MRLARWPALGRSLLLASLLGGCDPSPSPGLPPSPVTPPAPQATLTATPALPTAAHYVGSDACKLCHLNEYNAWRGSDHQLAMAEATAAAVRGQFPGTLAHHGQTTRFHQQDGQFFVQTDTQTTQPAELRLKYTFGIFPLQQYLVEQPGGKLQSLPFAWDTRPKEQGGQRWFHLYPDEPIVPGDALHWQSNSHNANHMCIECHTTDYVKEVDVKGETFSSRWHETGVGCESCHGPGSRHLEWTQSADKDRFAHKGWNQPLTSGSLALWQRQQGDQPPVRSSPGDDSQVERCAQCHSRRSRIDASNAHPALLDAFLPSLLEPGLYYPDGQIQDEVYEYGSFLQSRMHHAGVTCSNCHNPHSGKPRVEGNGLCLQCHDTRHDEVSHTLHAPGTPGSQCVDCHMPARTYMQVDARRDHSFRIPRPDLSSTLGTPYACQQCHADQTAAWATAALARMQPHGTGKPRHAGEILHAGFERQPSAFLDITSLAGDPTRATMLRATAASLLTRFPTRDATAALGKALGDHEDLVRLGALQACESLPPEQRRIAVPLLQDARKAIRIEAARILSSLPDARSLPGYIQARDEYEHSLRLQADRAPARVSMATLAMHEQRWEEAEHELRQALALEPWFVPATVNLADLLRLQGRDQDAATLLQQALSATPDQPDLLLSLGLLRVRQQDRAEALVLLEQAARHSQDPHYHFVHALALQGAGRTQDALKVLDQAADHLAWSRDVQQARVDLAWQAQDPTRAQRYVEAWLQADPEDPAAQQWRAKLAAPTP